MATTVLLDDGIPVSWVLLLWDDVYDVCDIFCFCDSRDPNLADAVVC